MLLLDWSQACIADLKSHTTWEYLLLFVHVLYFPGGLSSCKPAQPFNHDHRWDPGCVRNYRGKKKIQTPFCYKPFLALVLRHLFGKILVLHLILVDCRVLELFVIMDCSFYRLYWFTNRAKYGLTTFPYYLLNTYCLKLITIITFIFYFVFYQWTSLNIVFGMWYVLGPQEMDYWHLLGTGPPERSMSSLRKF